MSKVEDVAESCRRFATADDGPTMDEKSYWLEMAKEAILALREPTQEIIDAAEPAMCKVNHIVAHAGGVQWDDDEPPLVPAWRAMIDACLK